MGDESRLMRVILASHAMATRFELVLWGEDASWLRAAGEEALEEIARLEALLSFYRPSSELSGINARAAADAVPTSPRLFHLLLRARELSAVTGGAFDITVAPLLQCWGFVGGTGQMPGLLAIEAARELVGIRHVLLDEANYTVRFDRPGVMLDLGAIGKGYAVDCAIELLRECGVTRALLHGGGSTVYAVGAPPDDIAWRVAVQRPFADDDADEESYLAMLALCDTSLSVSAPHGKWFLSEGRRYGHVIDPRSGYPASRSITAAVVSSSATDGDALSTALLTLGPEWLPDLERMYPGIGALVASEDEAGQIITSQINNPDL